MIGMMRVCLILSSALFSQYVEVRRGSGLLIGYLGLPMKATNQRPSQVMQLHVRNITLVNLEIDPNLGSEECNSDG